MVPLTVWFLAACFGYGWGTTLEENYPSTTESSWSIGTSEENLFLNPNPTSRSFLNSYLLTALSLRKMADDDSHSKMVFHYFNRATSERNVIDLFFYSWHRLRKEMGLDTYAKLIEDEQTTNEVSEELEGFTRKAYEVTESDQNEVDDNLATKASTDEVELSYNDGTPRRSGRVLKKLVETKSVTSSTLPEDTVTSTSNKEYSFVTNLKVDRGTPGVDYPDYYDIPATSFSCSDKTVIPGFYADLETGCQVFHACWSNRRESLLCPVGTTFNQTLMKCDYWYNTNCSMAPLFFDLNIQFFQETSIKTDNKESMYQTEDSVATSEATKPYEDANGASSETKRSEKGFDKIELGTKEWNQITDFLPIKAKVMVYSESGELEKEPTTKMPLPLRSALKSKQVLAVQDRIRKVQVASRIVNGALGLAERVAKETAKFVMEVIKHNAKSEERTRKVEAAAKIVDDATDLVVKVGKDTAQLVNRITLETMMHQGDKSADEVIPAEMKLEMNLHDVKHRPTTTPKTTPKKSLEINPRFVVKPAAASDTLKHIQQLDLQGKNYDAKYHVLEIIDKAFEMVLSDIFPDTRQAILESYVKVALSKH